MENTITLRISEIFSPLVKTLSAQLELPPEDAKETVDHLIRVEQSGKTHHGLTRVNYLISSGSFGHYGFQPSPEVTLKSQGHVHISGDGCLGYPLVKKLVTAGLNESERFGHCLLTGRSIYPSGALSDWANLVTEKGAALILMASSPPRLAPPGGSKPVTGTNPLCIGVPTLPVPFIADLSAGAITHGRLLQARAENSPLPEGAAVDEHGAPCTDAGSLFPARKQGALLPFGNSYKAFALAMAVELLTGISGNIPGSNDAENHGLFGIIIGSDLLTKVSAELSSWVNLLSEQDIRIPGENSFHRYLSARQSGTVTISRGIFQTIEPYLV